MQKKLEILVKKANEGDKKALESLIIGIKDFVYNLSLKMLLYPEDAKDASQEILVKITTHLSTFKYQSSFKTWVYRIAVNYLINAKGKQAQKFAMPFEDYEKLIDLGQKNTISYTQNQGEINLLEEEVKVSCTHGLLLCLTAKSRAIYILGELLEFNSKEGAAILGVSSESFRKQLSRSRQKIRNFLHNKCGLANPKNPCRCQKKVDYLINEQIIDPDQLRFAPFSNRSIDLIEKIKEMEKSAAIYKSVPAFEAPAELINQIKNII